jgi:hypothetical protein
MNREYLLNRLNTLENGKAACEQNRNQAEANRNAFLGAIEEIKIQLAALDAKDKEDSMQQCAIEEETVSPT